MKLAMLFSNEGLTVEQIILSSRNGALRNLIDPALAIASQEGIRGITRTIEAGMPMNRIMVYERSKYTTDEEYGEALIEILRRNHVEVVGLYGWREKVPHNLISAFTGAILNQHSGPLDPGRLDFGGEDMYGMRVHCARLYFARLSGRPADQNTEATAHFLADDPSKNIVVGRSALPIAPDDTPYSLAQRLLPEEHTLQIAVLDKIAKGNLRAIDRQNPLIGEQQEHLLEIAKTTAKVLFPNG